MKGIWKEDNALIKESTCYNFWVIILKHAMNKCWVEIEQLLV